MRHSFSLWTAAAALVCLAPTAALAGDPEADRLIYDAFQKHLARLAPASRPAECENFLRRYPENLYAPEVKKLYRQLTGRDFASTEARVEASGAVSGLPVTDPSIDFAAEAAGSISGEEDAAAAALAGESVVVEEAPIPDGLPPGDFPKPERELRPSQRYSLGIDFAASALVGPGLNLAYTPRNNHWLVSAALRAPTFQTAGIAFEARYLFSPHKAFSGYLGGTLEAIQGPMEGIIGLVDRDFTGRVEDNGAAWGALAGVQKVSSEKTAWYLEASYQILNFATNTSSRSTAVFPGVSFGYLYSFR